ncbi:MAG: protein phosphatase 2C domain-containing protein [Clostridia bacterium]|nr:protein phosphatase 2C domain-containing protein [Clostridia bacterium]
MITSEKDESFYIDEGQYRLGGSTLPGKKHLKEEMPCQDAVSMTRTPDGWIVLAIADGVSSSPRAELGARCAVRAVSEYWDDVSTPFATQEGILPLLRSTLNFAQRKIDDIKKSSGWPIESDCCETTLGVALIIPGEQAFFACVGDGGIYILDSSGKTELISEAKSPDSQQVTPLSAGPQSWHFCTRRLDGICSVVMVTDGIADTVREKTADYSLLRNFLKYSPSYRTGGYRDFCREVLEGDDFAAMTDDAAVVFWQQSQVDETGRPAEQEKQMEAERDISTAQPEDPDPAPETGPVSVLESLVQSVKNLIGIRKKEE